jgi:hypothetical protein
MTQKAPLGVLIGTIVPEDKELPPAKQGDGQSLVTFNLKDFPEERLLLTGSRGGSPR